MKFLALEIEYPYDMLFKDCSIRVIYILMTALLEYIDLLCTFRLISWVASMIC